MTHNGCYDVTPSPTSKIRLKAVQGAIFFVPTSGLKMTVRQYRGDGLRDWVFLGNMQYRPVGYLWLHPRLRREILCLVLVTTTYPPLPAPVTTIGWNGPRHNKRSECGDDQISLSSFKKKFLMMMMRWMKEGMCKWWWKNNNSKIIKKKLFN